MTCHAVIVKGITAYSEMVDGKEDPTGKSWEMSFYYARKLMETTHPVTLAISYATVVKATINVMWQHNKIKFINTDTDMQVTDAEGGSS